MFIIKFKMYGDKKSRDCSQLLSSAYYGVVLLIRLAISPITSSEIMLLHIILLLDKVHFYFRFYCSDYRYLLIPPLWQMLKLCRSITPLWQTENPGWNLWIRPIPATLLPMHFAILPLHRGGESLCLQQLSILQGRVEFTQTGRKYLRPSG